MSDSQDPKPQVLRRFDSQRGVQFDNASLAVRNKTAGHKYVTDMLNTACLQILMLNNTCFTDVGNTGKLAIYSTFKREFEVQVKVFIIQASYGGIQEHSSECITQYIQYYPYIYQKGIFITKLFNHKDKYYPG